MTSLSRSPQRKLKSRMSHLVLMTEVLPLHPKSGDLNLEEDSNEHRPLLQNENDGCRPPSGQQRDTNVTSSYSLVPDASLPAQVRQKNTTSWHVFIVNT